jgi:formate dehydrogenase major subunit
MNANVPTVTFEIDGRDVEAQPFDTLFDAAARAGIDLPHLCHKDGLEPAGNCRACVVEVDGERTLAPSCCRHPAPGMKVRTDSARAVAARKMVLELLLSDLPPTSRTRDHEAAQWA